jgi:hypothetical protein
MAKWMIHNYGEKGAEGFEVEVEAQTLQEAIEKAPSDWQDPEKRYYGGYEKKG